MRKTVHKILIIANKLFPLYLKIILLSFMIGIYVINAYIHVTIHLKQKIGNTKIT